MCTANKNKKKRTGRLGVGEDPKEPALLGGKKGEDEIPFPYKTPTFRRESACYNT